MTRGWRRRGLWLELMALAALMGAQHDGWAALPGGCGGGGSVPMLVISGQLISVEHDRYTWQVAGQVIFHPWGAITVYQPQVTVSDEEGSDIWSYDETGWITVATPAATEVLLARYAAVMLSQRFPRSRFGCQVTDITWTGGSG